MAFSRMIAAQGKLAPTARFPLDLPALGKKLPALIVRYAGDGNDAWTNAMYKVARQLGASQKTAQRERTERELEAPIWAETVVVGWEEIYEDDPDKPGAIRLAEFSVAKATEFLLELARDEPLGSRQFDGLRRFCQTPGFFREAPQVSAEDLGKE